ncbi:ROK family protein [Corynebacterium auriscanis]|uniref:ROK family protein n=1 Tax=Corynebacterium auriscanis TaxID=99807 RepID=UPI003CEE5BBB
MGKGNTSVAEEFLTIGVDIGGTNFRAAVVDKDGTTLAVEQLPTPSNVEDLETALEKVVRHLCDKYSTPQRPIIAVGLAIAGFVDETRTRVRFAPHLPWRNTELVHRLRRRLELPVIIEHDANSAAWGEYFQGAAQGAGTWVLFALGTGIGAAVMHEGTIYRGAFGTAPEFGHLTVMPGGRACPCGKMGCLERYCSGSALPLTAQDLIATGCCAESKLAKTYANHPEEITGRAVVRLAREGDSLAQQVIEDMATWLGRGLALVQDVFDPSLIVVGGGVSRDADLFLTTAQTVMTRSIVGAGHRQVARVVPAQLGGDAGMIGVALLARREVGTASA